MIEVLDIPGRRLIARTRLDSPKSNVGPLTREGLARLEDQLMLLPGDLGRDAAVFHFRCDALRE